MTTTRSIFLLLLLVFAVALAGNHHRHQRHRRNRELHDWLTEEQKNELRDIDKSTPEFKNKVGEFYKALPEAERAEWNKYYYKHCFKWTEKVQTESEQEDFENLLKNKDGEGVRKRVDELKVKLADEKRKSVDLWENECIELVGKSSRKRRELDPAFQDFIKWMTPEQKTELVELKASGKPENEIRDKTREFFGALPADKQAELIDDFKGKCKVYFKPLLTDEETEKIKTLTGDKEAIGAVVKGAVNRQEGGNKAVAEKMYNICGEVYKGASRKRREINSTFKDFIKWMTPEQKTEIEQFKAAGKTDEEIREKTKQFFGTLPEAEQSKLKDSFKGNCKVFFKPLLTDEETEKIKTLSGDHTAIGALVKGAVDRQEGEKKEAAQTMLDICGEVFKDASRKRRELDPAFKDFVAWLTPEQKTELGGLKSSGKSEDELREQIKKYFGLLSADKQTEIRDELKGKCKVYFAPLLTADESAKVKELVASGDKDATATLFKEVVNRQEGNTKTVAEKMYNVCGEVYKQASRMRRELDPAFKDFVAWLTPEQKTELGELKSSGKSDDELREQMKKYFGLLPADKQTEVRDELKGKCKIYFAPLLTADESAKVKELVASGDKDATATLFKEVVNRQEGATKTVAEKMYNVCGEVYKQTSRMRRELDPAFNDFVAWLTPEQKTELGGLKSSGKSEDEIREQVKKYFGLLSNEKQTEIRDELKGKCKVYFAPLLTADESAKVKELVASGDKDATATLFKEVVNRQEGTTKTVAEKMYNVCGEVYKQASRKRRELDPAFKDFVAWLTPEQKTELGELKSSGKSDDELREQMKKYFGLLPADKQTEVRDELKGKCKIYFAPLLTADESAKVKELVASGDKDATATLFKGVVNRQEGATKTVAEKMYNVCGEVYKQASRMRRELDPAFKDFVAWLTPEQKTELGGLKSSGKSEDEIREQVKKYFGLLPNEKQTEIRDELKGKCKVYFAPLLTADESAKVKELVASGDKDATATLFKEVVNRQEGTTKTVAEKMYNVCGEVYKQASRKRRELDPAFKDFVAWLTPEQKTELGELKSSGKSEQEIQEQVKKYFGLLPADKQTEIKDELKGKCKVYFEPLLTADESTKVKELVASGDKEATATLFKEVVNRQEGTAKTVAEKMYNVCGQIYKHEKKKMRRDVRAKIEKHLAWLNPEEKDEIIKMTNDGVSKEEIRKKLFNFVEKHEKDSTQKEKSIKSCYQWMDEVATKEEITSLHSLHHVDHGACKKKVREFISRLPEEKQKAVEASLPFCEKLWYGDHADHADHSNHHDHSHHHRMKRHFVVIEKFLSWMDDAQKSTIKEMENSGAEFGPISDKIREFFALLPAEKQTELKTGFKNQCMIWAKEVAKPGEWESIKKHYAAKDFEELKLLLVELEGRLTENQKHTIEHVRGVCYKLWDIKGLSRLRRVPQSDDSLTHLDWLNAEQLAEVKRLKDEGKKGESVKAVLKFYDEVPEDKKADAEKKLREGCKTYSIKVFGADKVSKLQKMYEDKADKEEIVKTVQGFIAEITDETKKDLAEMVVMACKHVHGAARSRRVAKQIEERVEKYVEWTNDSEI